MPRLLIAAVVGASFVAAILVFSLAAMVVRARGGPNPRD